MFRVGLANADFKEPDAWSAKTARPPPITMKKRMSTRHCGAFTTALWRGRRGAEASCGWFEQTGKAGSCRCECVVGFHGDRCQFKLNVGNDDDDDDDDGNDDDDGDDDDGDGGGGNGNDDGGGNGNGNGTGNSGSDEDSSNGNSGDSVDDNNDDSTMIIIIISGSVGGACCLILIVLVVCRWQKQKRKQLDKEECGGDTKIAPTEGDNISNAQALDVRTWDGASVRRKAVL